ncbi:MAG TPA: chemotaxis protein CheW, partial [Candidatus Saccharimonadales bacterium]|nr:chemotaxis protein CheW [Candidatus Saccharimonadales bacterium]
MRRRELKELPWVGFRVGEARLAVEASMVRGVAWNRDLLAVPFTQRSVAGVMVRAGRVVPVFDLALVPAAWTRVPPPGGDQIVILGEGEMEAGILAAETATF